MCFDFFRARCVHTHTHVVAADEHTEHTQTSMPEWTTTDDTHHLLLSPSFCPTVHNYGQ